MCWLMIEYTTNGSEVKIIWRPQNLCADIGFYKVHDRTGSNRHPKLVRNGQNALNCSWETLKHTFSHPNSIVLHLNSFLSSPNTGPYLVLTNCPIHMLWSIWSILYAYVEIFGVFIKLNRFLQYSNIQQDDQLYFQQSKHCRVQLYLILYHELLLKPFQLFLVLIPNLIPNPNDQNKCWI